jgi:transposase-like protein
VRIIPSPSPRPTRGAKGAKAMKPTATTVSENEAAVRKPAASTRYCPRCKRVTDHALVVQLATGYVAQSWRCLACGCDH